MQNTPLTPVFFYYDMIRDTFDPFIIQPPYTLQLYLESNKLETIFPVVFIS